MSTQLEDLFHDLDAPAMSVSPDAVVAAGQHKVRRRRALWGAGTGALAAAAAVAIAVGTALPNSSSTSPMPAHTPAPALGSFFSGVGTAPLPRDEAQFGPMASGSDRTPTPQTTYQVYRGDNGDLRIRRIDKDDSLNLPEVARYADGGSATNDRSQTVVVRPVPADVTTASLYVGSNGLAGGVDVAPIVLSDGTTAALFVTQHQINPLDAVGDVSWWTTAGALQTSTGESAEVVTLPAPDHASTVKFWYLPMSARCGVRATFDGGAASGTDTLQTGGICSTGLGYGIKADGTANRSVWALMMPGPITDVETHPQPGQPNQAPKRTSLSDGRVLLWSIHSDTDDQLPYKSVTWTGPDGAMHTWPGA